LKPRPGSNERTANSRVCLKNNFSGICFWVCRKFSCIGGKGSRFMLEYGKQKILYRLFWKAERIIIWRNGIWIK
jgi:hypothetical protein